MSFRRRRARSHRASRKSPSCLLAAPLAPVPQPAAPRSESIGSAVRAALLWAGHGAPASALCVPALRARVSAPGCAAAVRFERRPSSRRDFAYPEGQSVPPGLPPRARAAQRARHQRFDRLRHPVCPLRLGCRGSSSESDRGCSSRSSVRSSTSPTQGGCDGQLVTPPTTAARTIRSIVRSSWPTASARCGSRDLDRCVSAAPEKMLVRDDAGRHVERPKGLDRYAAPRRPDRVGSGVVGLL